MTATQDTARTLTTVPLDRVTDNPWQPRAALDSARIQELAESIEQVGLLQPPLVRPLEGWPPRYQLAFGHYRVAALRLLGREAVDVEVRHLSDAEMAVIALVENVKRIDVRPIEQYRAWKKALDIEGMTIQWLADSIGLDRSTISNYLRLLQLPAFVLEWVDEGSLSAHGAREFLCLMGSDGHFHADVAQQVIERLTTGAPDWRVGRVRLLMGESIVGRRTADWRKLFAGHPGGSHMADGDFDVAAFVEANAPRVHAIPNDEWRYPPGSEYMREARGGRVEKEGSRQWTCATPEWAKARSAAKAASVTLAGGVAAPSADSDSASAKTAAAGKTANFAKQLVKDPVFKTVAEDTPGSGTLLKSFATKGELAAEAKEKLGTRAEPRLLKRQEFKAFVDARTNDEYLFGYGSGATKIPSYFPDIVECRTRCTIGASYARAQPNGPLYLFCFNKDHFEEKLAAGRAKVQGKIEGQLQAVNASDARFYEALAKRWSAAGAIDAGIAQLLVGTLLIQSTFGRVAPDSVRYDEREAFARWPANVERIAALLNAETPAGGVGFDARLAGDVQRLGELTPAALPELLLRLVVNAAGRSSSVKEMAELLGPVSEAGPGEGNGDSAAPAPSVSARAGRQRSKQGAT